MNILKNSQQINQYIEKLNNSKLISDSLLKDMKIVEYNKDEYIYMQEEFIEYLFILISGTIKVSYLSSNGKEITFRFINEIRIVGEIELLLGIGAISTVQAIEKTICILLPIETCKEKLLKDVTFLRYISRNLAEALSVANNISSINQNLPPKSRIVSYILSIEKDMLFTFDYKIASSITGVSERHIFRIIRELLDIKVLEKRKKNIEF